MLLTFRFQGALCYAFALHNEQSRKGTDPSIPYFSHLIAVTSIVLDNGGNEDEAIAALLHDAVEDQGGMPTLCKIQQLFGNNVAEIVDGCTDSHSNPKPPWEERKVKHLARLQTAPPSVILVSIADKLHNASSVLRDYEQKGDLVWERFKGGKSGTLWHHRELLKIFHQRGFFPALTTQYQTVVEKLLSITAEQQD